nr:nucleotidyl transferase AbiEii/AbiGii toxin family protein [Pasteurella testudinis]
MDVFEQAEILQFYSDKLAMRDTILEKDIWLCWVLKTIFSIPNRHKMAFKGGTSLSKVFGVIDRFSEDIDITLDYRDFDESNTFNPDMSKSQIRVFSNKLKEKVKEYRDDVIVPELAKKLKELPQICDIRTDDSGEKIWLSYPSVLKSSNTYMKEEVLIELGGRNVIDPNDIHRIETYIGQQNPEFDLPSSDIVVLSPQRTFWEKATLIHVECHRGLRENAERLSRHWYDLVKLYNQEIGKQAMNNRILLEDVVTHKSLFFNASYAHYDDCLRGGFRLKPDENGLSALADDYTNMCRAGMIYDSDEINFDYMMQKIDQIAMKINALAK